jgi:hypothetical protein
MNGLRQNGVESLAIPHNSNISGGAAFPLTYYNGDPIDESMQPIEQIMSLW